MVKRWGGRRAQRITRQVLAVKGTRCHLCGHAGADSADHLVPRVDGGSDDLANLEPAHCRPCPTCGRRCNTSRGARSVASFRGSFTDGTAYID